MNVQTTNDGAGATGTKSNAPTVEDYLAKVLVLGQTDAKSSNGQITFDLLMVEGAYHGTFDLQPNKHGPGRDDATLMAEQYSKGFASTVVFDSKKRSSSKLISNIRKCHKVGTSPQWGQGEPLANTNTFVAIWKKLRAKNTKGLNDVHNALLRYFTAQLKDTRLITGDALEKFCYMPNKEPKTNAEILRKYVKGMVKLTNGKFANCPDIDTSGELKAAIQMLNTRLTNLAKTGV